MNENAERFVNRLTDQAESNPLMALMVATALIGAASKLIKAYGDSAGSRAYAKKINYDLKHKR